MGKGIGGHHMSLMREVTLAIDNRPEGWRQGQAAFNRLYELDPELVNSIRSHFDLDPFYRDDNLPAFFHWLVKIDKYRSINFTP